ncbi:exodeoxyribonuclease III [Mycolicibacterium insubricum]|uniref:Exodeoxyribonuclease III n=1 Tax=Mycolicibacterium insubricum TaxID=444597 RepID=A0A1X0DCR0_9MYCO|nr:exodeoxyribonuclease III [Mycolicibacterium insubricum]ORA70194.1 exodeoxyribonuclease III [Mycolicibacterium insubricum]BBZ66104.1 exodeoxyribonuclease III [Mycolicibacterium insubricum]
MIVTTINVNGIRAAVKQRSAENLGLLPWLTTTRADVVCLQETRADDDQLAGALAPALDDGWHLAHAAPSRKGRNGVAVLARVPFTDIRAGCGHDEFADHGRYLEVDLNIGGDEVTVASIYVPTGEAETERQAEKERFLAATEVRLAELVDGAPARGREAVVCGDWNIAHAEADLKNWRGNRNKAGFLPEERQWVADRLAAGWSDVVRGLHPGVDGPYSWWSWRGKAFDNDAGWRIDYQLATAGLAARAVAAGTERPAAYALRWSDHAPVTVEYR